MALSQDRQTLRRDGKDFVFPVAATKKLYAGALVALNNSGYATPGAVATTLIALGRAEELADNSGGSNGDITVRVMRGIFRWNNSTSGDAIANTDIGATCYIVDDQTVAKTDGSSARSAAGKVVFVDAQGVWVDMR